MVTTLKIIFFISLAAVVHNHFIYPLLMLIWGKIKSKDIENYELKDYPEVHIIFAAFNEEKVIKEKIESSFATTYPQEKLKITVGSDCSDDKTNSIVKELQNTYKNLELLEFTERRGKSTTINELVKASTSPYLILTDANILFKENTIEELVKSIHYSEKTGAVGGNIEYLKVYNRGISSQENFYLRMENAVKSAESRLFGTAMGLEGGCYIIRRKLFPQIPHNFFMEDFFVSLSLLDRNYEVKFNKQAVCFEDVSVAGSQEYKRKVRISIGNFQNLAYFKKLLYKRFFPVGIIFFSHKVLRWFTPVFLLLIFICSVILTNEHRLFNIFAGVYCLFLSVGMIGILFSRSKSMSLIKYPGHFIYMNMALLVGMFMYLKGVKSNVWEPTQRKQAENE